MTAGSVSTASRASDRLPIEHPDRWHRPLLVLAAVMVVAAVVTSVLAIIDPREITGANGWFKPLKFEISIAIYAVTMAWLIGQFRRFRRTANVLGWISAIGLGVEMVIIIWAASVGTTSHFNVATPFNITVYAVMAGTIATVWIVNLLVGIGFLANFGPDAARNLAVLAGVVIGLAGMAVAFLMTSPTEQQDIDFQGIAGAHTVGLADGGPGLPFFGWSTVAGDLRVPHFIGMHALQLIPLALLALELAARRIPVLRSVRVRFALVLVGSLAFGSLFVVLTQQALIGQPVTSPTGGILVAEITIFAAWVVLSAVVLLVGARVRGAAAATPDADADAGADSGQKARPVRG